MNASPKRPGSPRKPIPRNPARVRLCAWALKLLDQAARAFPYNRELGHRLTREAGDLIGPDALLAIFALQQAGKLPREGTPAWDEFRAMAEAGDVEIATVIHPRSRVRL